MSEGVAKLVHMANQIAANLAQEPDPAAATAEHIRLFWDPRMRVGIAQADQAALSDIARSALALLAQPEARA